MDKIKLDRCLKFTGYLYVPTVKEVEDAKLIKSKVGKIEGRLQVFDKFGKRIGTKMIAFNRISQMSDIINKAFIQKWKERLKEDNTKKKINKSSGTKFDGLVPGNK